VDPKKDEKKKRKKDSAKNWGDRECLPTLLSTEFSLSISTKRLKTFFSITFETMASYRDV
jgi:hypothetical protein